MYYQRRVSLSQETSLITRRLGMPVCYTKTENMEQFLRQDPRGSGVAGVVPAAGIGYNIRYADTCMGVVPHSVRC